MCEVIRARQVLLLERTLYAVVTSLKSCGPCRSVSGITLRCMKPCRQWALVPAVLLC